MTREEAKRWIYRKFNSGETEKLMADLIIQALEQEPCEDAISRQAVLNQIFYSTDNSGDVVLGSVLRRRIDNLPSVKPQEPYFWEKCPYYEPDIMFDEKDEYDMGKCTYKQEPKKGHWIKYGIPRCGEQHYKCTSCEYYINFGQWGEVYTKQFKYCPNCGARMESEV